MGQIFVGLDVTGAISLGQNVVGQEVSGAELRGAGRHWGKIPGQNVDGQEVSGAGRRGADLRGAGRHWGRAISLRQSVEGQDVTGAKSMGQEVSGAEICGAGCRGDTRPARGSKLTLLSQRENARTVDGYHPSMGQDVTGAISLGQEVSGAGGSGAGSRESRTIGAMYMLTCERIERVNNRLDTRYR